MNEELKVGFGEFLSNLSSMFNEKDDSFKRAQKQFEEDRRKETQEIIKAQKEFFERQKINQVKQDKPVEQNKKDQNINILDELRKAPLGAALSKQLEPDKAKQSDGEQKNIGPEITKVEFSEKTQDFMRDLFNPDRQKESQKALKEYYDKSLKSLGDISENTKDKGDGLLGFLGKLLGGGGLGLLGTLLAAGGVGALLVGMFWDKIKNFILDKFGISLDFLDKFKGTLNAIAKFFTTGGLKILDFMPKFLTGSTFTEMVGNAFKTFGSFIENSLTGIFKFIFGDFKLLGGGAKAAAEGGEGIFKTLLPKIAGGLFKGIGKVALKGIPVIGSLISFYFAIDRYQKGDYIGAVIDLVGGVASLLDLIPFLAPFSLPISLGAAALNAFLDYKTEGKPDAQGKKFQIVGDFFTNIWNWMKKAPLIGGLVTGLEGWWQFFYSLGTLNTAGMKEGLEKMEKVPLFGVIPSMLLGLINMKSDLKKENKPFTIGNALEALRKRMAKTIINWFPDWFGIRKTIAEYMGITLDGEQNGSTQTENMPQGPKNAKFDQKKIDQISNQIKDWTAKAADEKLSKEERKMYSDLSAKALADKKAMLEAKGKQEAPKNQPQGYDYNKESQSTQESHEQQTSTQNLDNQNNSQQQSTPANVQPETKNPLTPVPKQPSAYEPADVKNDIAEIGPPVDLSGMAKSLQDQMVSLAKVAASFAQSSQTPQPAQPVVVAPAPPTQVSSGKEYLFQHPLIQQNATDETRIGWHSLMSTISQAYR